MKFTKVSTFPTHSSVIVGSPDRITYYDNDNYLFAKCVCKVCRKSPLYYIPIKKEHKDPHIYKY